jgi:hypothetical protein
LSDGLRVEQIMSARPNERLVMHDVLLLLKNALKRLKPVLAVLVDRFENSFIDYPSREYLAEIPQSDSLANTERNQITGLDCCRS